MSADASAYAALGLEPGADAAAIERAYKRLIKQYHPDREGGDVKRAAEINHAYRELRRAERGDLVLDNDATGAIPGDRWARAALLLLAIILLLFIATRPIAVPKGATVPSTPPRGSVPATAVSDDAMGRPLTSIAINQAVAEAVHIARHGDEMALSDASRACQRAMRANPSIRQLDHCAAFDDAVVQLQDRDPLRDGGPFSELAVTGRLMSAASLLSSDYLAIDGRLDRIRLHVELILAPTQPEPQPPLSSAPPVSD